MLPTTKTIRKILHEELNKQGITSLHTYTEKQHFSGEGDKRYVVFVLPQDMEEVAQEIVEQCNKELPDGKFRVTISPKNPPFVIYDPKVFIRATGMIE